MTYSSKRLRLWLENICSNAFQKAFPELLNIHPEITLATKEAFGHFQCNEAMKLAKPLKRSPVMIANEVLQHIPKEYFSIVEVAGAGFINFTLSQRFLEENLQTLPSLLTPGSLIEKRLRIIVDYSSPNTAKDMHVGHLRSTIIGDCLAKVYSFLGHDVLKLNHIGDWGTAFGMLIAYIQENNLKDQEDIENLTSLYQKSRARFDEDEKFKSQARKNVVLLQKGDPKIIKIWESICEASRKAFNKIYSLLDVSIEERGESFYNPFLPKVIEDLEEKGLVTLSDGAKCVFHDNFPIPLMIQKSDGGYSYDTTDIAAMRYRIETDRADKIIIVTDSGQSLHFNLVAATALAAGYLPSEKSFTHVGFGLVLDTQGKKFKTRSGESIKLIDLLLTAINKAMAILLERDSSITPEEAQRKAQILGINAVKYADLSCHRTSDYVFSFDKMLRFEGNTAMFILYSYVRIQGIKRRLQVDNISEARGPISLENPAEKALAFKLLCFPDVLLKVAEELFPHLLTDYLYELAEKFNIFFRDCHIEGSEYQESRLNLCLLTERILSTGMSLLGLQTLDSL
ncbi:arginine--tRNA ligase [Chlamydiifrater phoenicopteri]|uniref:arginine--tRNA ligase n=1 Tax=Chlamydiifrater phoenicopteri TaxID=2681469 RepID=UPI001BCD4187|nr:arginine--tRNA ligase [Chlamydiifrater phoenicopteri]